MRLKLLIIFILSVNILNATQISKNRIISLVPSNTELLFAMGFGDDVVGISDYCNYPAETKRIVSVGGLNLNLEKIASLRPSIVIDLNGMHARYHDILAKLGVNYVDFKIKKIADIPIVAIEISKLLGEPKKGLDFQNKWNKKIANLKIKKINKPLKVYFEIWDSPKQAAGTESYINDIIEAAGGENVIQSNVEYPTVNSETIAKLAPEVIFISYPSQDINIVKNRPGWDLIPAVKNNRIYKLKQDFFVRPGPRNLEAIEQLNEYLSKARR